MSFSDELMKYSKQGRAFVLPTLQRAEVVLPPSDTSWIASKPENVLSGSTVQDDGMGLQYLAHGPTLASVHDFTIIRRDLTRYLGRILPEQIDEISHAFEDGLQPYLSKGDGWQDVPIHKVVQKATVQVVTRIFLGLPICRNKDYIEDAHQWATAFGISGLTLWTIVPEGFKPIIGRLLAMYVNHYKKRATRHTLPTIKTRIQRIRTQVGVDTSDFAEKPDDVLQWLIDEAAKNPDSRHLDPMNIATKLLMFNLFAEHTTYITLSTVLFDMLSYSDFASVLARVRAESDILLPKLSENPTAIREMVVMDSVIRETLRFNPMIARGPIKEVVAPGGVITPGGLHIPRGCHISSSASAMQRDPDFTGMEDADQYDPLRYCDREENATTTQQRLSAVQISDKFLAFGLGKNACPGRFFAVQTLKIMLGHLFTHYDFEPLAERPKFFMFGELAMPSESTMVRIRRRAS